jgi:two-component system cell cycle response regulator
MVRSVIGRLLKPFECELFEAENGEIGLGIAKEKLPNVIILDYNMPVMDGVTMLTKMREDETTKSIPVIMLTADANPQIIATVARLGVKDYITKPFKDADLIAKIGKIVPLNPKPPAPAA